MITLLFFRHVALPLLDWAAAAAEALGHAAQGTLCTDPATRPASDAE